MFFNKMNFLGSVQLETEQRCPEVQMLLTDFVRLGSRCSPPSNCVKTKIQTRQKYRQNIKRQKDRQDRDIYRLGPRYLNSLLWLS